MTTYLWLVRRIRQSLEQSDFTNNSNTTVIAILWRQSVVPFGGWVEFATTTNPGILVYRYNLDLGIPTTGDKDFLEIQVKMED